MRGLGRIFKRGCVWWIAYCHRGKEYRESSRSEKPADARRLLKKRLKEILTETFTTPSCERVTVSELLDDLIHNHELNKRKGVDVLRYQVMPLRRAFGEQRTIDISEMHLERYKEQRLAEGRAAATINKELGALRRAFHIAVTRKVLSHMPNFELLKERNVRQGFLEYDGFCTLVSHLPRDLQDVAWFAFLTGWRKGEILSLCWTDVDLNNRIIRLPAENSKNDRGRFVALEGQLYELLKQRERERQIRSEGGVIRLSPCVFHRGKGKQIQDFRGAWKRACESAGFPGLLFHDLRRSAVRNMVRAGVSETVAMQISGHRTRAIFDRYNITSERDIQEAVQKTQAYLLSRSNAGGESSRSEVGRHGA